MIDLPPRGITLADGWWALILWAGKDVENRARGTAARLRGHRGSLLLTANKASDVMDMKVLLSSVRDELKPSGLWAWTGPVPFTAAIVEASRGRAVGIVDLVDAGGPSLRADSPWAMPDCDHLLLANPRPIEPFPLSGARGVWHTFVCPVCGLAQGLENEGDGCRRCARAKRGAA